jgi:prolipoprotein diacylglyceryltransferase
MMEEDEQRKIDLKKHALPPVSRKYLLRIIMYVVMLAVLGGLIYYVSNREVQPKKVKDPIDVKEIRGFTLTDSL